MKVVLIKTVLIVLFFVTEAAAENWIDQCKKGTFISFAVLAPSVIATLVTLRIYKNIDDVPFVRKRTRRGRRGGRKKFKIDVLVTYGRLASQKPKRERCLVSIPRVSLPPRLIPDNNAPTNDFGSDCPPVLSPQVLSCKHQLPNFLLSNVRSLTNKVDELDVILRQNNIHIAAITETWQLDETSGRMAGYKVFLNTRTDRIGGGVALYVRDDIPCKYLDNFNDPNHEAIWALCKPKHLPRDVSCIIIASIYYPESAKNRRLLVSYLQSTLDTLRQRYSRPGFIIAGDFNQTKKQWLANTLGMSQVVKIPTHVTGSTLDLILTNLAPYYKDVSSNGPLGKSDHHTLLMKAKSEIRKLKKIKVLRRPITKSAINTYGMWVGTHCFSEVYNESDVNRKAEIFQSLLYEKYLEVFPEKQFVVSESDKPWITPKIKQLIREKTTVRQSSGDATSLRLLRNKIVSLCREARKSFGKSLLDPEIKKDPRKWHRLVRQIAGKTVSSSIRILNDDGSLVSANDVNNYFTDICTSFPAPTNTEIENLLSICPDEGEIEIVEYQVFKELNKLCPSSSSFPEELPIRLIREFSLFLAKPLGHIISECFAQSTFPSCWKRAFVRVIPKTKTPKSCNELRPISITSTFAKVTESFILRELLKQTRENIDRYQYGGLKGCNTSIYLVRLVDIIFKWLDKGSTFIDLALADFRKAFDLICHLTAAKNMRAMGAQKRSLALVMSFLQDRMQCVFPLFEGDLISYWSKLTCGAPQGTRLAGFIFISLINFLLQNFEERLKFVDDLSFVLKYLVREGVIERQFSETLLASFSEDCERYKLTLNADKSTILRFCPLKRDLEFPQVPFPIVPSAKILGVTLSMDCTFTEHVEKVIKAGNASLQTLVLMRRFGCDTQSLKNAYITYVRPLLEYAVAVWGPFVQSTHYLCDDLESLQKRAVNIIVGNRSDDYNKLLQELNLESLSDRRLSLIMSLGKSLLSSPHHRLILPPDAPVNQRTRSQLKLQPPVCRTNRYKNTFVPFFVEAYNKT